MFEIKDENGNIVDFNKLTKEQQDKIIQVAVDCIYEVKDIESLEFTKENFDRLVESVKNYDYVKHNSDLWDSLAPYIGRRNKNG
jgi:hypothetical protein